MLAFVIGGLMLASVWRGDARIIVEGCCSHQHGGRCSHRGVEDFSSHE